MKESHPIRIFCKSVCILAVIAISTALVENPTEATITNGLIKARLYLPDAEKGYYRATRFDWSGIISSLECNGHSYYGQWFRNYSPTINDAIMGPVESFDPLGYDKAQPGGTFVKIGVGVLTKPNDSPYNFATYYPITNAGKWKVKVKKSEIEFSHNIKGIDYGYEYTKIVKLVTGKPIMILSHSLKNIGTKTIITSVFDHNFFMIDNEITGPSIKVTFPVADEKIDPRMEDLIKLQDNQLIYLKELNRRSAFFKDLTNGKGGDYKITIENHHTGAGVKITADKPISKLAFWSISKTVCPEPYINIKIEPGQTFTWNINYEYYSNIVKSQKDSIPSP